MKEKVLQTIKKYNLISPGDSIVLGVSGGPDSIAMLHTLNKLAPELEATLIVAHINHMIRPEASEEEEFVSSICKKMQIEFYSKSIDVQKIANTNKKGLEETGRKVRYEFFNEVLKKTNSNKIAIAHNKNDKVETILMNILRGSGTQGLRGIEPIATVAPFGEPHFENPHKHGALNNVTQETIENQTGGSLLIRPLIECERSEIEEYCDKHNLAPRIDKTNLENDYTRNKVRNIVIPYIQKEFNPNIIETIDRLSNLSKQEDDYLKNKTEEAYKKILIEEIPEQEASGQEKATKRIETPELKTAPEQIILNLKEFNKLEKPIQSRLVLYTISKIFGTVKDIEKIHIEDIVNLCTNNIGNKYLTPNKNTKVLVKNHKIYVSRQKWVAVARGENTHDCNKKDIQKSLNLTNYYVINAICSKRISILPSKFWEQLWLLNYIKA